MRLPWQEWLAGAVLVAMMVGMPVLVLAYQRAQLQDQVVVTITQDGLFSPSVIRARPGEQVRLRLRAEDVEHGFRLREAGVKIDRIYPGHPEIVEFTAPLQPGEYPFTCNRMCGPTHQHMSGVLVVSP